ncbi:hypothetical protein MVG78_02420 [Roseomonas gilardii subsp. gilardii]|uniref:hypothetical protein n=1 Tax=Roseomonas gilardii TaxID=257708 RepID=UPI001FFB7A48|nr:hypothetical protein [Roseomonas gilardii]UPG73055.1 hypothetical protein MVG78_02420 [Roseomonas gilardii subsp. gilardii]
MAARRRLTAGAISGNLDAIGPMILLAKVGWDMARHAEDRRRGRDGVFALGLRDGQRGSGAVQGLILPLSACTNAPLAAALGRVAEALPRYGEAVTEADAARVRAAMAGSGLPLLAQELGPPGGRVVLNPDVGLFCMLSAGFRYVSAVMDDPGGVPGIAETLPFRWPRPVDFMEWLHAPEHRQWWLPVPYLLRDGAAAIGMWSLSDQPFSRLSRPELRLDQLLRPRADVARGTVSVRVTADRYGWAELVLGDEAQQARIALSNVYPPLEDLAEWTALIARGDLPLQVEIDEEGSVVALTALPTGEGDLLLLLATDRDGPEVRFQGLVRRRDLATAMAHAILAALVDPAQAQGWSEFFDDADREGDEDGLPDPRVAIRGLLSGILDR